MMSRDDFSQAVALDERGFNFGDGHFTTIRVAGGQAQLCAQHLTRLHLACHRLRIPFQQWGELIEAITRQAVSMDSGVLKVIITRGCGGRGYSSKDCSSPNWYLQQRGIPAHYVRWSETGIGLKLCDYQQTVNPVLAGLKTLNRLDQVMIRQELDELGYDDGLVCSTEGFVIETSAANIFWVKDDVVYTPDTGRSGVEGVMKAHLLDLLALQSIAVVTGDYPVETVLAADEVFISNAVMQIVPVIQIGQSADIPATLGKTAAAPSHFALYRSHQLCRRLQHELLQQGLS